MRSLKTSMLLKFCLVAAFSIAVLALTVSWKLRESISIQSIRLADDLTERSYETLKLPHQTFTLLMREDIRHSVKDLSQNPILIQEYAARRLKAVREELRKTAMKDELDFIILLNMRGQLESSFPADLNDFDVEDYIKEWDFGAHVHEHILRTASSEQTMILDSFAQHNPEDLERLDLSRYGIPEKGALSVVAASLVTNDFSEALGVCIIGKFLNHDKRPLENLNKLAGYSSAIYLDTTPVALAGFTKGEEEDTLAFQIDSELQHGILGNDVVNAKTSTSSGVRYLISCSALKSINEQMLGMLCIGLPEARIREAQQVSLSHGKAVQATVQAWIFGIGTICLIFFAITSLLIANDIVTPLKRLSAQAQKIADGDIEQVIAVRRSQDEIGELSISLQSVVNSYQNISKTSQAIAVGKLHRKVEPRSARDSLGKALREMSEYLNDMSTLANAFARGDLTQTIEVRSDDDILGQALIVMTEGLRNLIAQIKEIVEQISSTESTISTFAGHDVQLAEDVYKSVERMTATMTGMELSVVDVARNMETLSSLVQQTSASASQMTVSISDIASNTSQLTQQAAQSTEFMENTVDSLEKIICNTDNSKQLAQETSKNAFEGQQAVEQVMLSMETIQQTMTLATNAITEFASRSQEIDTILDVIRDITEQTSLLALNASIIAAQSGVHGRGFAIVADEIKNLALGVSNSTKDIANIVQSLRRETSRVVQAVHEGAADVNQGIERTQQAQEALNKIIASAQHSSFEVEEIARALQELMTASHIVFSAMEQVNKMSDDITGATKAQQCETDQIQQAITHINMKASEIQLATVNQLEGVHEVLDSTKNVSELIDKNLDRSLQISQITKELSSQARQLLQSVDRFKLHNKKPTKSKDLRS